MFHSHSSSSAESTPTALPPGTFVVHRRLGTIEGYRVDDAAGQEAFRFKGHFTLIGQKWSMSTPDGTEVADLARPPMHVHPTFTLSRPGRPDVTIRKTGFAPVHETWAIEGDASGDVEIHGDMLNHEFSFERGGATVGTTTRRWISITDAFAVQVDGLDPILAIATAVGIDALQHENQR